MVANCGYGSGYSVLDVLDCVRKHARRDFPVIFGDRRPGDSEFVVADPSLARHELGWIPRYNDLDVIVETSLSWEGRTSEFASTRSVLGMEV